MFRDQRIKRLASITRQVKRDWIANITEYDEVKKDVRTAIDDNLDADCLLMAQY